MRGNQKRSPRSRPIIDDTIAAAPNQGAVRPMESIAVPIPVLGDRRILGVDEEAGSAISAMVEDVNPRLNPCGTEEETARLLAAQGA